MRPRRRQREKERESGAGAEPRAAEETLETSSIPQSTGASPAGRAGLSSYHRRPPAPGTAARPPVRQPAAARLSVTSRDRSRGGALRPSAHARSRLGLGPGPGPGPAQEELRGRALAGALPEGSGCGSGCRGLGRSWKGGGREGRLSCGTESSAGCRGRAARRDRADLPASSRARPAARGVCPGRRVFLLAA